MNNKLKVGVIGTGYHCSTIIYPSILHAGIKICAIASKSVEEAKKILGLYGIEKYYLSYEDMLEKEKGLDAVIIVSKPELQFLMIRDCIEYGAHVFVEKPPCLNLEEANKLVSLSNKSKRLIMVGLQKRYAPAYKLTIDIIRRKDFGEVTNIYLKFVTGKFANNFREFLFVSGIHVLDLARHLSGEIKTFNVIGKESNGGFSVNIIAEFENSVTGIIRISSFEAWCQTNEFVDITGEGKFITIENMTMIKYHQDYIKGSQPIDYYKKKPIWCWEPNFVLPHNENKLIYIDGYVYELMEFFRCIRTNEKPLSNISDTFKTIKLIEEILKKLNK